MYAMFHVFNGNSLTASIYQLCRKSMATIHINTFEEVHGNYMSFCPKQLKAALQACCTLENALRSFNGFLFLACITGGVAMPCCCMANSAARLACIHWYCSAAQSMSPSASS